MMNAWLCRRGPARAARSVAACVVASAVGLAGWPAAVQAADATHYVDQRHPAAADEGGAGTADKPFKTISAAAAVVKAGDTVLIGAGVYREAVTVAADGTAEAPIVFRAADGERVVVTGADTLTQWEKVPGFDGNVFRTPWPHRFITHNKNFAHPDDDFHRLVGRAEQVFVQGYPLRQVLEREQLARGTFFADLAEKRLYAWSRDDRDLAKGDVPVEASVRPVIWTTTGQCVRLKGLRFRYCANAAQRGAVQLCGHHDWVEDCLFEHANSIGCQFGGEGEAQDILARRCTFRQNGQMGFSAVRAHGLVMVGCTVRDNSTKGWNRGWEAGGNKIVLCRGLVLAESSFVDNGGNGIWFDIGNEDCEVRNCYVAGNDEAGIFYEISFGLRAHDNVIVGNGFGGSTGAWGANGGISLSSSPRCIVERNLIVGNREGFQLREQTRTTPRISDGAARKGHPVWNHDETVRGNYIACNRDWQVGGWFDVLDGRHWPEALQTGWEKAGNRPAADVAADYKAKGQPLNASLEQLQLKLADNAYWPRPPQGLLLWGCTWRTHRKYADLEAVRKELGLEAGSVLAEPAFADAAASDFRLPPDHPALRMKCYPQGPVPGVRLGAIGRD